MTGNLEKAVQADLDRLPPTESDGGLAELALILARTLDRGTAGLRDTAAISRELRLILLALSQHLESSDPEVDRLIARLSTPIEGDRR